MRNLAALSLMQLRLNTVKVYRDIHRLFKRGELVAICKAALADHGPLDTRQLSHHVMAVKGFGDDNELRKSIAYRIVQALRMQAKRGGVIALPKRNGVSVWRAPSLAERKNVN